MQYKNITFSSLLICMFLFVTLPTIIVIAFAIYEPLYFSGLLRGTNEPISIIGDFLGKYMRELKGVIPTLIVAVITMLTVMAIRKQTKQASVEVGEARYRRSEKYRARLPLDLTVLNNIIDHLATSYDNLITDIDLRSKEGRGEITIVEINDLGFQDIERPFDYINNLSEYVEYGDCATSNEIISILHLLQLVYSGTIFSEVGQFIVDANSYRGNLTRLVELKTQINTLLIKVRNKPIRKNILLKKNNKQLTEELGFLFKSSISNTISSWAFKKIVSYEQIKYLKKYYEEQ